MTADADAQPGITTGGRKHSAIVFRQAAPEGPRDASQRRLFGTAVSLASLMAAASAASAQESGGPGLTLPTIDVSGEQGGYQAIEQTINRLQTPLKDTPQTVNVVPQQVIREQRAATMEDALRTVPGITFSAGEGGQQGDSPYIRGFVARGDIFRDGFRDPGWYTRDLFSIDRVEVYKGPSSFAFGRGSTGGAINNVSKLPTGQTSVEGTATVNTGPGYRADLDAQGVRGNISGRVAAMGQSYDTPGRDSVWTKRWGVAPSATLQLDDDTKATLAYIYQGEEGSQDYGVPYLPQPAYSAATGALTNPGYNGNGSAVGPVPVARNTWYGYATGPLRDDLHTDTHILTGILERRLGGGFKVTNGTRYIDNSRFARVTAPRSLGDANNKVFASGSTAGLASAGYPVDQMTIGRERRERETDATSFANQTDLTGKFATGMVEHTVAAGFEYSHETRSQTRTDLCTGPTPACRTGLTDPMIGGAAASGFTGVPPNYTDSDNVAVYVSDQMKVTRYVEFLVSLRNDRFSTRFDDQSQPLGSQVLQRTDNLFSQRYGVVFHPWDNVSIYAAYGNSFNPSAELGTLSGAATNTAGVTLDPEKNKSYEAGIKVDVLDNRLSLTGAVFRIDKTNLRVLNDPSLPAAQQFLVLDGLARVDGVEVGAAGKLSERWSIVAGYSYLHSEIARTGNLAELGRRLPNTPEHNVTLWSTYELTPRWTVGGGATYQSLAYVNTTNTAFVPSFWKFDAMVAYKIDDRSTIQLNIYNIGDAYYYAQYYGGHAVPASGRWASLSWRVRF